MRRPLSHITSLVIAGAFVVLGSLLPLTSLAHAAGDSVDEIHYSYGDNATSVVFDWHGQEQNISYGLTTSYDHAAVAGNAPFTPVDSAGPFREIRISGLQAGTTYHYQIGPAGLDHTFSTEPTGDYTSVDIGDSMSSSCPNPNTSTYMPQMQQLIAAQNPTFITHGGDIAIANQCGQQAVHRLYTDIEAWSHSAAFQVAWGNHEYGPPTTAPKAPAGTPADTLVNYKTRDRMSNAQTVPNDNSSQVKHPGCGKEIGSLTNTCMGDDWGYYTAGHVFYITYPEPETGAYADWQTKADTLMAAAQADPTIDFIVTYGHRPAYTSSTQDVSLDLRAALSALAAKYSPATGNLNGLNGKYVMSIQHHAHTFEAFSPKNGLTFITDGAGGQGFSNWATIDPNSVIRLLHFGVLVTKYTAATHTMNVSFVCGSNYVNIKDTCAYGTIIPVTSFVSQNGGGQPAIPVLTTGLTASSNSVQVGQQVTYTATAQNTATGSSTSGASLAVTVPSNMVITSASGANVNGNTATWDIGTLTGGTPAVSKQLVATLTSGTPGQDVTTTAALTTADTACSSPGSSCVASASSTVISAPTSTQWVANQSIETDFTGWTGMYNSASQTSRVSGGYDGLYALRNVNNSSATGTHGVIDKPHWLDGTSGKTTVAGKVYTGSVWVKADTVGQKITLFLREFNAAGAAVNKAPYNVGVTVTASSTNWFNITEAYPAVNSGDSIGVYLYSSNSLAHKGFNADLFSLTSPTN